MSKNKDKREKSDKSEGSPFAGQPHLLQLLVQGDNRSARAEAQRLLTAEGTSEPDKDAAREALGRVDIDRGALAAGLGIGTALIVILALAFH